MKLQLPTLIIVFLSIVLILLIHFLGSDNKQVHKDIQKESQEFQMVRADADNAHNAQDFTEAIYLYEQALDLRPENAEICNDLGAVHYKLALKYAGPEWPSWPTIDISHGSAAEGIAELDLAIKNTESGYIILETNSTEIAKTIEEHAKTKGAEVFPYYGNTHTTLNILIGPTKDHLLEARSLYLKSVELKSNYEAPYRNLGSFYMKIGLRDKAINVLQEALKRQPGDQELEEYLQQFQYGYSY